MIELNRKAIVKTFDAAKAELMRVWRAWDVNRSESLGQVYFDAIETIAKAVEPRAAVSVDVSQPDGEAIVGHPLHVHVRVMGQRLVLTFTAAALSGAPHSRATPARMLGVMLILARLSVDPRSEGVEFTMSLSDEPNGAEVGFCAADDILLVPDSDYLINLAYSDFRVAVDNHWQDWISRKNRLFWRGSTTGFPRQPEVYVGENWFRIIPRTEACARLQSSRVQEFCDVGISLIAQLTDPAINIKIQNELARGRVERIDQVGYRYQLDIDGNSNAWSGLFQAMLMGSCVLKVGSERGFRQWYYDRIQPWRHFVPIASDMSDLEDKVAWAVANEDACLRMAAASYALGREMAIDREVDDACQRLIARFAPASRGAAKPVQVDLPIT